MNNKETFPAEIENPENLISGRNKLETHKKLNRAILDSLSSVKWYRSNAFFKLPNG